MTAAGCQPCEENTYLSNGGCVRCSEGMISEVGSTSESDCVFGKNFNRFDSCIVIVRINTI